MRLQLCARNLERHGEAGAALQRACEGAGETEVKPCLDRCAFCERAAIALVDGRFVGARDAATLADQLSAVE